MRRILFPLVATALVALSAAQLSQVFASSSADAYPHCAGGVVVSDVAGDTAYPPADVDDLEDPALDLVAVRAGGLNAESFTVVLAVADLADHDPPAGTHALYSVVLVSDAVGSVELQINRSNATGDEAATIGDFDATHTVDLDRNEITVTAPRAALGEGATIVGATEATSASSVVVGGPIVDRASGAPCVVALDEPPAGRPATNPGNSYGNDRVPGQGQGNGNGNTPAPAGPAPVVFDPTKVTVAVIDSGLHGAHQEFDFDETRNEPNGQLVAWWDFSGANQTGKTPDLWYEEKAPYDTGASGSHGTGTSSMAVGRNLSPAKTPSACPGCRLAFAKVLNENDDDVIDGDLAAAIRWAVDVVHADVISMSIGAAAPIPEAALDVHEAATYGRSRGVLMVVSNGNGWGNAGVPGQPGGLTPYGNSTSVLSVGATEVPDAYTVSTDPEVTALFTVTTGENTGGYHSISGTSFSAPFVAGAAARVIAEARGCGASTTPESVEQALKVTAKDTETPPMFEGYGSVDLETVAAAIDVVCGRAEAPTPDPVTSAYVDNVSGTERDVWTNGWSNTVLVTPITGVTGPQVLGPSAPSGVADAEIYEFVLEAGATVDLSVLYGESPFTGAGVNDFDTFLYVAEADSYDASNLVARSAEAGEVNEHIVHTNRSGAREVLRLAVVGWSVVGEQSFSITGLPAPALVFDGYVAGEHFVSVQVIG